MHNEDEFLPHLIPLPMMRRIVVINVGQGLFLVNLSHVKRSTTVNPDAKAQLTEGWEMML